MRPQRHPAVSTAAAPCRQVRRPSFAPVSRDALSSGRCRTERGGAAAPGTREGRDSPRHRHRHRDRAGATGERGGRAARCRRERGASPRRSAGPAASPAPGALRRLRQREARGPGRSRTGTRLGRSPGSPGSPGHR